MTITDFEAIKIIGRGAYGEVRLCRWLATGELVAIKKMKKKDMIKKNEIEHIRAERTVLSKSSNKWTIDLKCSFQDDDFLYLVMEYSPGGDLMNMLIKKDIFSLEEARFYIAETVRAVEYVHSLGYVHRDINVRQILFSCVFVFVIVVGVVFIVVVTTFLFPLITIGIHLNFIFKLINFEVSF